MGLVIVGLLCLAYSLFFSNYMLTLHTALGTNAEDMGIMDQVFWNTLHGHFWHQTICNPVSDMNCLGDISRWGIHFEPSQLLLIPIYALAPHPQTLLVVQTIGVALGAFPAYWLASRRAGSVLVGIGAALLYLAMPVLRAAVTSDFHMVTLAAPALMFALYFLYDRQDVGLCVAALFAIGTKEQVPIAIAMLGLLVLVGQRRWRLGTAIILAAGVWAAIALLIIHLNSPLGASPTAIRYGGIMATLERLPLVISDPQRRDYLWELAENSAGLGIFAPWALALGLPSALLNAVSAFPNQYTGVYQYNTDIAPFLWLAAVEGWCFLVARLAPPLALWLHRLARPNRWGTATMLLAIAGTMLLGGNLFAAPWMALNLNTEAAWPQITKHDRLGQALIQQIPAQASVSAQGPLVPHLSQRSAIYQFPDGTDTADYVLLDTLSNIYPEPDPLTYGDAVRAILHSGVFIQLARQDGYILLVRATALQHVAKNLAVSSHAGQRRTNSSALRATEGDKIRAR